LLDSELLTVDVGLSQITDRANVRLEDVCECEITDITCILDRPVETTVRKRYWAS